MLPMKKRIVVVRPEEAALKKLGGVLWRSSFEVHRVSEARQAAEVCAGVEPQIVVVPVPIPDMKTEDLIASITGAGPPSRQPTVVLLADKELLESLEELSHPKLAVLDASQRQERLQAEVLKLINAAARVATRFLIRLQVHVGKGTLLRMCQTENISESGMLLRSEESFPIGSEIAIEIAAPGDEPPIRGRAKIVRNTNPEVEKLRGIGVQFTDFADDGQDRLRGLLAG
jgi:CheY-like chemotaxis protein